MEALCLSFWEIGCYAEIRGRRRKENHTGFEEEVFSGSQHVVEADIKHQKEVDERKQDKEESVVIMYLDTLYCLFFF